MTDWQPELRLWQAVINQALHDAFNNAWREELHQMEAISFLLSESGNWKASRDIIADVCGYSSSAIRTRTLIKINENKKKFTRINGKQFRVYPEHKRT